MATQFERIVAELRRQEQRLAAQLNKVRQAISLLEFGTQGVPRPAIIETPHAVRVGKRRTGKASRRAAGSGRRRTR